MGLFHEDPPDDELTRRWNAAQADLDDVFSSSLNVSWYSLFAVTNIPDLVLKHQAIRPFYYRGGELEDLWWRGVDNGNFSDRFDAVTGLEALAVEARAALLNEDGSSSQGIGQTLEDAGDAAVNAGKKVAITVGVVAALVAAVAVLVLARKAS